MKLGRQAKTHDSNILNAHGAPSQLYDASCFVLRKANSVASSEPNALSVEAFETSKFLSHEAM